LNGINNDETSENNEEKIQENKGNVSESVSSIIKNMVEKNEDEGDYEFDFDNKSAGNINKLKEDLINNNDEE
jgi:hypothetical protein